MGWQGLNASLLGVIPYAAVRLGMYDGLKWAHKKVSSPDSEPAQAGAERLSHQKIVAGHDSNNHMTREPLTLRRPRVMMPPLQGSQWHLVLWQLSHLPQLRSL